MDQGNEISDSSFILLAFESIKYILSKKLDPKIQNEQLDELGQHLGERVSNFLMNSVEVNASKNKKDLEFLNQIMRFLGKDVWIFLFGKQIKKLQRSNEGIYSIDSEEIKLHCLLLSEKNNQSDEKLDAILTFICGILKGVINSFNLECTVTAALGPGLSNQNKAEGFKYEYIFKISFINFHEGV